MSFSGSLRSLAVLLPLLIVLPAPAAPTADEIARAVKQLGDDDFAVREKASRFLWEAGQAAEAALHEATKSTDIEVVNRATEILDKFRWGIFPDTPEAILGLINDYRRGDAKVKEDAVKALLSKGIQGYRTVQRFCTAEQNPNVRQDLARWLARDVVLVVPSLLVEDKFAAVEEALELSALSSRDEKAIRNYVACLMLRNRVEDRITFYQKLANQQGNTAPAAEILAYLFRTKGDLATARTWAEKSGKDDLLDTILFLQRDWKALHDRDRGMVSGPEELGMFLAYQRLSGRTRDIPKTVAALRQTAEAKQAGDASIWWSAKPLFLNDLTDEGLAILPRGKHHVMAMDVLGAQLRFREAFALADKTRAARDKQWVSAEVCRARMLYDLGEKEAAVRMLPELEKDADSAEHWERRSLVSALFKLGQKESAFAMAARWVEKDAKKAADSWFWAAVFPEKGQQAMLWWRCLRKKTPDQPVAETIKRVRDILGHLVGREEFAALVREARQVEEAVKRENGEILLTSLAECCLDAGREDLARECLQKAGELSDTPAAWRRLAEYLAERKQWREAAEAYGKAWQRDQTRPDLLAQRALALKEAGQVREGKQQLERARWLALGDEEKRYALAEVLRKHGLTAEAKREHEMNLRLPTIQSWYLNNALDRMSIEAAQRKDYLTAADLEEMSMLMVIQRGYFFTDDRSFVRLPHKVHVLRARGLLDAGKIEQAVAELRTCQKLMPGDLDRAILFVPALEKVGHKKEAQEVFEGVFAAYDGLCREYPKWAKGHNSLAWLCARCRRQLDTALAHAEKAVTLEPKRATYLDTLAEVHFQRGDKDRAVATIKKCLEMEPKSTFYAKQLRRYEAGDPKAELPDQER